MTEPAAVRLLLTVTCLGFLALFLLLPLTVVFVEAFRNGIGPYFASIREPDAIAALKLTLIAAAFAVPANLTFGVAAGWAIAKFRFPGRTLLTTLIDLRQRILARNHLIYEDPGVIREFETFFARAIAAARREAHA